MIPEPPKKQEQQSLIVDVSLVVTVKNNMPCLEMRKVTTHTDLIKILVSCAFHNRPVIVMPTFKNTIYSLNQLVEKGVLYCDKGDYYYTF